MIIALVLAPMLPMVGCVTLISGMFSVTFRGRGLSRFTGRPAAPSRAANDQGPRAPERDG